MYIALGVFGALSLLILILSYITFRMTFLFTEGANRELYYGLEGELDGIKKKRRALIERLEKIPSEDVFITSYDGLTLRARYYHNSDKAPLDIQFHGYKSMAQRDFSGGAYECISRGHNVLLVDQRAHGKSSGKVISFGIKERRDVLSWIDYALNRFGKDTKIMLYGISMGAATVLMASEMNLPKNVVGIVADCPYSSPRAIIKKVIRDMKLPSWLFYPFVRLGALIFGGFDPNSSAPVSAVKDNDIPILLIHGDADDFVPCEMSDEIKACGRTVTYVKIKDATHGLSYLYDYGAYTSALDKFINEHIGDVK